MPAAAEKLRRHTVPGLMIRLAKVRAPARALAALRRATGKRGRVTLFVAFDDPASALAIVELDRRLKGRNVDLETVPVIDRDMAGDPAIEPKREYAVVDAARLAERYGLTLSRSGPIAAADLAFLAQWVASSPEGAAGFVVAAARMLWFETDGPVDRGALEELWGATVGTAVPDGGAQAVTANEKRMKRSGAYAVPMATVHGRLYFAHERLDRICDELDSLGWTER